MLARDVMTPDPIAVTPDEPIARAARIMRDRDVGFLPVVVDRASMRVEGVLTDRDIVTRCVATGRPADPRVGDCMSTRDVVTVGPDAETSGVAALMARAGVRRVPVVDAQGRLVGVLSRTDLARVRAPGTSATAPATRAASG